MVLRVGQARRKARLVNFSCNFCSKIFSTKNQLNRHHVKIHKEPMSCTTCSTCNKIFSTKNQLNRHHVQMHKEPMSCTTYYKTFSSKKMFLQHRSVHLPPTFICETCDKAFTRGDHLTARLASPHSCPVLPNPMQQLWQDTFEEVQPSKAHAGGPWRRPSFQDPPGQILGEGEGAEEDQLRYVLHHLQHQVQLQGAYADEASGLLAAGSWTIGGRGQVRGRVHGGAGRERDGRRGRPAM